MGNRTPPSVPPAAAVKTLRRSALVLAGVSAAVALGFFVLTRAVVGGRTTDLDRAILLAMRTPGDLADPIGPLWFEEVCRDFTALGGLAVLFVVIATATAFFWLASMRHAAVYVAAVCFTAILLNVALKSAFSRPRPELAPHRVVVYSSSYPSGHSAASAAVYLTLGMMAASSVPRRRLKALFLGVAFFITGVVGASRVYLGVHWPTDVVAGWAVGFAWALVCWCVASWLQDAGVLEREVHGVTHNDR